MSNSKSKQYRNQVRKNAERENLRIITLYMDGICNLSLGKRIHFTWNILRRKNPFKVFWKNPTMRKDSGKKPVEVPAEK